MTNGIGNTRDMMRRTAKNMKLAIERLVSQ